MNDQIAQFLRHLQLERGCSTYTIKAYATDLNQFVAFCDGVMQLEKENIRSWVQGLLTSGKSAKTVHRKVASLRSCCTYLIQIGEISDDPTKGLILPKVPKRAPEFISEENMQKLLHEVDYGSGFLAVRNRLVMSMLFETGMRRSELANLTMGQVDLNGRLLRIIGKGNKERIIPVGDRMIGELKSYLKHRGQIENLSEYLVVATNGKGVQDQTIYAIVKGLMEQISHEGRKSPHVIRHSFATHMLNKGVDVIAIKDMLGHESLTTVEIYAHNSTERLRQAHRKAFG